MGMEVELVLSYKRTPVCYPLRKLRGFNFNKLVIGKCRLTGFFYNRYR